MYVLYTGVSHTQYCSVLCANVVEYPPGNRFGMEHQLYSVWHTNTRHRYIQHTYMYSIRQKEFNKRAAVALIRADRAYPFVCAAL